MLVKDIDMIKNFELLFKKKIVLYGAGNYGKRAKIHLDNIKGTRILAYVESDPEEWKRKNCTDLCEGIQVKGIDELREELINEDAILIITVNSTITDRVISQIQEKIPQLKYVYTWFGMHYSIELHIDDNRINQDYREEFLILREYKKRKINHGFSDSAYNILKENPVIVFQPGKVGSSSICMSLEEYGVSCAHIHFINSVNDVTESFKDEYYDKICCCWRKKYKNKGTIKIISLVRDPIGRNISYYFQMFDDDYISYNIPSADTYSGIKNYIKTDASFGEKGYLFQWFDDEIKSLFGIDIYEHPFDKKKGYTIIKKDNIELLLMTMEKMNENEKVLGNFVGIQNFKYVIGNVGLNKGYKYAYGEVLNNIEIDQEMLDFYYKSNSAMDHFYTDEEKSIFMKKWKHKL